MIVGVIENTATTTMIATVIPIAIWIRGSISKSIVVKIVGSYI
jgi:hypothetical protein